VVFIIAGLSDDYGHSGELAQVVRLCFLQIVPLFHCNGGTYPWMISPCRRPAGLLPRTYRSPQSMTPSLGRRRAHFGGAPIVLHWMVKRPRKQNAARSPSGRGVTRRCTPLPATLIQIE